MMAGPVKCPNPSCAFLFDPSRVPPGAVIACPLCNLRFTLGPTPAQAPPPQPAAPPTRRSRIAEATPAKPRGSGLFLGAILAVGGVLLFGGIGIAVLLVSVFGRNSATDPKNLGEVLFSDMPVAYKPLDNGRWSRDNPTETAFAAALAYVRTEHSGWLVVDAAKFDYQVRPADLRERVRRKLGEQFKDLPEDLNEKETTLAGKPALKFEFRGDYKASGETCLGEAFALAAKDVGVWIFHFAPEREYAGLADEWGKARGGLRLIEAADAGPVRAFSKSFRTKSGLFTVTDHEGIWAERKPATDVDRSAELWMEGVPKGRQKDLPPLGTLLVAVLPPEGTAAEQAEAHVLKQMTEGYEKEEMAGEPKGEAPPVTDIPDNTPTTRLKLRYKGADVGVNKLVVYAVTDVGDRRVVAYGYCQLRHADLWERRLMQMVGSLKGK